MNIHQWLSLSSEEGSIRLVGGNKTAGRVEIYLDGEWGTVCDDGFNIFEAKVVCRQLGFTGATAALSSAAFGAGSGPIHMDNLNCGYENQDLLSCRHSRSHNCDHNEDAGVVCFSG